MTPRDVVADHEGVRHTGSILGEAGISLLEEREADAAVRRGERFVVAATYEGNYKAGLDRFIRWPVVWDGSWPLA